MKKDEKAAAAPRFAFGRNWAAFLRLVDDERLELARNSLQEMLGVDSLEGKSLLDAGSGSGLFSLAAAQLGAHPIVSFDFDQESVACTRELKRRFRPQDEAWRVEQGDCLDPGYVSALGSFDVVYSWGVLHHTGDMWRALEIVAGTVAPSGQLYIALYNDQGWRSRFWRVVKRSYCTGPVRRALIVALFVPFFFLAGVAADLARGGGPLRRHRQPRARGMSTVRDWYDWLGGYPFEVAQREDVRRFLGDRGFAATAMKSTRGLGCNEFVFRRP